MSKNLALSFNLSIILLIQQQIVLMKAWIGQFAKPATSRIRHQLYDPKKTTMSTNTSKYLIRTSKTNKKTIMKIIIHNSTVYTMTISKMIEQDK